MPSSTSSSDQRLPQLRWLTLLGGACLGLVVAVAAMEIDLASRGFVPSVLDSETRWLDARERARHSGRDALVLVGGSRMKLDVDQEVLRRMTGLDPVQLALDGIPFYSVFKGVADDPAITGTVLVDFGDNSIAYPEEDDAGTRYEAAAEREARSRLPDFESTETRLDDGLHAYMRSYADGATPLKTLLTRVLRPDALPQYLTSRADRSTLADYSLVPMPGFYYARASINLGQGGKVPAGSDAEIQARFRQMIDGLKPVDDHLYLERSAEVAAMADTIRARGGRVIFAVLPESGMVRDIDDKLYPRRQFWDLFAAQSRSEHLNFRDVPELAGFTCPDGSHLDYRDRGRFTEALVSALRLGTHGP